MSKLVTPPMAALWVLFSVADSVLVQAGETRTREATVSAAVAPAPGGSTVSASDPGKPRDFSRILPGRRVARGTPKGPVQPDGANAVKPAGPTTTSSAAAPPGPTTLTITNLIITAAPRDQTQPIGVRNGGGGYFITWTDFRSGTTHDIYAQLVDGAGGALWAPGGVPVCKGAGFQTAPKLVPDGLGGAIVFWQDDRGGTLDIYAQRLNSTGVAQWVPNGVVICDATGAQRLSGVVSDGVNGAIAVWEDDRSGATDLYVQRIDDLGVTQWTADGVALCTASGAQQAPVMVTDQLNGAIVAWQDFRGGGTSDIYARRVSASGTPMWTADGVALCAAANSQELPSIAEDGAGGAIVGWADGRTPANGLDVYVRRVDASGTTLWTADGVALVTATGDQKRPRIVPDGAGGVVAAWHDFRGGANCDVYARRVDAGGVPQWTPDGVAVCTAYLDQSDVIVVSDNGGGGAFVAWSDARTVGNDIYAQRLDAAGTSMWTADGVLLCDAGDNQDQPSVVADGVGGAFVLWRDYRSGTNYDIYAQRVDPTGQLPDQCSPPVSLTSEISVAAAGPTNNYTFNQNEFFWTAIGVRADNPADDWDLETYGPESYGGEPYPTCFSSPVAGSYQTAKVDLVIGNFNGFHVPPDVYQARAFRYSGTGSATVEWDDGGRTSGQSDLLPVDDNQFTSRNTDASDVLECWDTYLVSNLTYTIQFRRTGGTADTKVLLFNSNGSPGCQTEDCFYFVSRSDAKAEAPNDVIYTCPPYTENSDVSNGWHGIVVVNDNGQSGSYDIKVVSGAPTTGVGDGLPSSTGLKGMVPNPARGNVQIQFRLREPGAVSFQVFDMAGRSVSRVPTRSWGPGNWSVAWNGRDANGKVLSPGLYLVQMKLGDRVVGLGRVTLLR